ncbi:protein kinase domain-containing protein [Saccharothrix isguenensis]
MFPNALPNAAELLEGRELDGGWIVTERVSRPTSATGGNFCVGYKVENKDGRQGFLKALNYARALGGTNVAQILNALTDEYLFERDLLKHCGESRMSKVVVSLADGEAYVDGCPIPTVSYIIFELADGDIRAELDQHTDVNAVSRLRSLHHVATGLKQLHQHMIAHQDLKPSNVLIFPDTDNVLRVSKVSDLGRATDASRPALHDDFAIAGDPSYAPPEQQYGATPTEFYARRFACDLYHLGSLATFMFTGASINALMNMELHPMHAPANWTGTYTEVLPYVRDAFGRALSRLYSATPVNIADKLTKTVSYLCDPDPELRGHPTTRRSAGNPYALDRIVTTLDLLTKRVDLLTRNMP